jgi:hypothetical protein
MYGNSLAYASGYRSFKQPYIVLAPLVARHYNSLTAKTLH